jgi:hypothetical protein
MKIVKMEALVTAWDYFKVNQDGDWERATRNAPGAVCLKQVDTSEFLDHLDASRPKGQEVFSPAGFKFFRGFCKTHGVSYYAAPRENFSEQDAMNRALKEGNTYWVAEDMS